MMNAAVCHQPSQQPRVIVEQAPKPEVKPGTCLLRIVACGVCHTDLHGLDGDWPVKPAYPYIPGHEVIGIIEDLKYNVETAEICEDLLLKKGDRVGVSWIYQTCQHCEWCLTGRENLCPRQKNTGFTKNGGWAEFMLADLDFVVKIPDALSSIDAAPMICAGLTTYAALKATGAKAGELLTVFGIGGLGHLCIQFAKLTGLRVIAVDINEEKLAFAQELGAEMVCNAKDESSFEKLLELQGAHASVVAAVSSDSVSQSLKYLRDGGTCVVVGLPPGNFSLNVFDIVFRGLTLKGSIVGTRQDLIECLELAARGQVRPYVHTESVPQIAQVLNRLSQGDYQGRAVLTFAAEPKKFEEPKR